MTEGRSMIPNNLPTTVSCPSWEALIDPIGYCYDAVRECGVYDRPFTIQQGEFPGQILAKAEGPIFPSITEEGCSFCTNYTLQDFRRQLDNMAYYRPWLEKDTPSGTLSGVKKWGCPNCSHIFSKEFQDVASNPPYCYKSSEE